MKSTTRKQDDRAEDQSSDTAATDAAFVESQLADLQGKLDAAEQRALRAQAEQENYRKRTQRDLAEERKYAMLPLASDLLAVVDNLQRAIDAATPARSASEGSGPSTSSTNALLEGVKMVAAQLHAVLEKHGCRRIHGVGSTFDPHVHQAIAQEASTEHPAGTVTREAQIGYTLHDRVIRPAQVFVSTGTPTE